jgi:hypothetical protein
VRYEHPYRLDAAVVDDLVAPLNRLLHAALGATPEFIPIKPSVATGSSVPGSCEGGSIYVPLCCG